jgi:serine/threonine protein kinase
MLWKMSSINKNDGFKPNHITLKNPLWTYYCTKTGTLKRNRNNGEMKYIRIENAPIDHRIHLVEFIKKCDPDATISVGKKETPASGVPDSEATTSMEMKYPISNTVNKSVSYKFSYNGVAFEFISNTSDWDKPSITHKKHLVHMTLIGSGTYGAVYRCVHRRFKSDSFEFVVKVFRKGLHGALEEHSLYNSITNGVENRCKLIHINHPSGAPFIVMEPMSGDMEDKSFTLAQIDKIMKGIDDAMSCMDPYLYSDLKPTNLLYKELDNGDIRWWFGDIGSICFTKSQQGRDSCLFTFPNLADKNKRSERAVERIYEYAYLVTYYILYLKNRDIDTKDLPKNAPPYHKTTRKERLEFYDALSMYIKNPLNRQKPQIYYKIESIIQRMYRLDYRKDKSLDEYIKNNLTAPTGSNGYVMDWEMKVNRKNQLQTWSFLVGGDTWYMNILTVMLDEYYKKRDDIFIGMKDKLKTPGEANRELEKARTHLDDSITMILEQRTTKEPSSDDPDVENLDDTSSDDIDRSAYTSEDDFSSV